MEPLASRSTKTKNRCLLLTTLIILSMTTDNIQFKKKEKEEKFEKKKEKPDILESLFLRVLHTVINDY